LKGEEEEKGKRRNQLPAMVNIHTLSPDLSQTREKKGKKKKRKKRRVPAFTLFNSPKKDRNVGIRKKGERGGGRKGALLLISSSSTKARRKLPLSKEKGGKRKESRLSSVTSTSGVGANQRTRP